MSQPDISAEVAEAQRLEDLTGMGVPTEELLSNTTDESTKVDTKNKIESDGESEEDEQPDEKKVEVKTEEKKVEDEKKEDQKPQSKRPARENRATKAIFAQINEIRNMVKDVVASQTKKETIQAIDKVKELAEKRQLDPDELKDIITLAKEQMMEDLEKSGKLNKDLPDEIKQRLAKLDQYEADQKAEKEALQFEGEWNTLLVELEKTYPNAKAAEKNEARKLMDELAHQKQFHDKDLDYVWYKNRSKFDAILKVAKGSKSGEESSKQLEDHDDEEDIDLDPENMTPEKMAAYDKKKLSGKSDGVEILG